MSKVIVVGGGPAGMFAAIAAAERGHEVVLLEKNEKLGKKLFITGKGRCNVTNGADMDVLFQNVCTNEKRWFKIWKNTFLCNIVWCYNRTWSFCRGYSWEYLAKSNCCVLSSGSWCNVIYCFRRTHSRI